MHPFKKTTIWMVVAAFFMATLTPAFAQENVQETEETEVKKERKVQWVPLPVVMYKPITNFGFGALGMALFRPKGVDTTARTSNVQAYFVYTLNGQILFSPEYKLFFKDEKFRLNGKFRYFDYPQNYYGLGNEITPDSQAINIDYQRISFDQEAFWKVRDGIFVSAKYNLNKIYNVQFDPEDKNPELYNSFYQQDGRNPAIFDDYVVSGLGLSLAFDTRDNIVNAREGHYLKLETNMYQKFMGSKFNFTNFKIDARKYFRVVEKYNHILAFQAYGHFTAGTAPFLEMAELGGENLMRGYSQGRYRDNHYMAFQAEYRMPIRWRFGLVAFGGFGDVAENFSDFSVNTLKPAYGTGLRITLNKKESVNVRADYGFGTGTSGFYLQIQEAF